MNRKLIIAGVLATLIPSAALAQPPDPNCVRSNNNSRVEGTVLGAGAGALLGSVLAGRHSRGTGAVLGAVGGGIGGNVIAGSRNDPCPPGYNYPPQGAPGPGYGPPPQGGPGPGYGPGPQNGPGYGPPQGPGPASFWNGAPTDLHQRFDFMQSRIDQASSNGALSPDESRRAYRDLRSIRHWAHTRRTQNGGYLSPDDSGYIQSRLDHLGASVHWMERTGY